MRKKNILLDCILAAIFIFCAFIVITDNAHILGLPQRAFNLITFFGVIPLCVGLSDIVERAHPELKGDDHAGQD